MIFKKKQELVELPENWADLPEDEQDAFLDAFIERLVPRPEADPKSE